MVSSKAWGTTGTSSACAIIRCSCSTSLAIWNGPCSGVASTLRAGVQSRELPASVAAAEVGEALVAGHAAGEADQDRTQGGEALGVSDLPDGRGGGPTRVVRSDPGAYPALRRAAAVGAAWLTLVTEPKVGDSSGDQRTMLRRNGIVVAGASGAGLARWSGKTDVIHGGGARSRLNREGHSDNMPA